MMVGEERGQGHENVQGFTEEVRPILRADLQ